jgi:hypothetical protein
MTKREAIYLFKESHKPNVERQFGNDKAAMRQAWNDYVDALQKNGDITAKQAETWDSPFDQNG